MLDQQEVLNELFEAMFLRDVGRVHAGEVNAKDIWAIITDDGKSLGVRAMLLQALVDEYVCVQKYA